jgi:RNA polymerase sigma factor (sigma-70 family)
VYNLAYCRLDGSLAIAESPCPEEYEPGSEQNEWTEEEITEIRAVLQKLTAIRILNPTDAEDLVQDTLLTMLIKHPGYALEKGLLVWTMGVLRKKVGNYYRRANRYICFSDREPHAQQSIQEFTASSSPESQLFHEELQHIIHETLAQLPSAQRQAIELLIAGHDSGEVVKQLHPERYQNVINHIHRGRKKLAKELARYGYGPNAKIGMRSMKRCRLKPRQRSQ